MNNSTSVSFTLPNVPFSHSPHWIRSEAKLSFYFPQIHQESLETIHPNRQQQKCTKSNLKDIPFDALSICFQFLPLEDLSRLGRVDRDLHRHENQFWKNKLLRSCSSSQEEELFENMREELSKILCVSLIDNPPRDFILFEPLIHFLEGALRSHWITSQNNDALYVLCAQFLKKEQDKFLLTLRPGMRAENAVALSEFHTKIKHVIQSFFEGLDPDVHGALKQKDFAEKFILGSFTLLRVVHEYQRRQSLKRHVLFFSTVALILAGIVVLNYLCKRDAS